MYVGVGARILFSFLKLKKKRERKEPANQRNQAASNFLAASFQLITFQMALK